MFPLIISPYSFYSQYPRGNCKPCWPKLMLPRWQGPQEEKCWPRGTVPLQDLWPYVW
jgi:hypothetical protein